MIRPAHFLLIDLRPGGVLVPVVLLVLASTVQAQSTYRDYLAHQVSAIDQTVARSGYRPDAAAITPGTGIGPTIIEPVVSLESTSSVGLELVLQAGYRYRIVTDFFLWDGDDCAKSLEDRFGTPLFAGTWIKDGFENVLDFTSPASGTHILVFNCPDGVNQFFYDVQRMSPAGSFGSDPDVYPSDMIIGFLRSGAAVQLELELDPGVDYLIAGVCDQDCSDLDLGLIGRTGLVLLTDELDDDAPVLQFTAQADELYEISVTMYACSIEPCSFAYKVYRR